MRNYATCFICDECKQEISLNEPVNLCPNCGGLLETLYDFKNYKNENNSLSLDTKDNSIWRYKHLMPPVSSENIVSLGEGGTPLIKSVIISKMLGLKNLYFKNDTLMPTGSFKDRGFSLAVSYAKELGVKKGLTYSSGNAGASFAAYSARGGLDSMVLVEYQASDLKKSMLELYGIKTAILEFNNFSEIELMLDYGVKELGLYQFVNFINPIRHEAMKTYSYEIFEQLGYVPDHMIHPVGTGGGIWGTWKGFNELKEIGFTTKLPKMTGVQPDAVCWLKHAIDNNKDTGSIYGDSTKTIAQSISGNAPLHGGKRLIKCVKNSKGTAEAVSNEEILEAMRLIASEGIAAEPASASTIAALIKKVKRGDINSDETVVCVITGTALKQPKIVIEAGGKPKIRLSANGKALEKLMNNLFN